MNDLNDQQLLRAYAKHHSDAAFAELVRRHVDLVYSAALRLVCEAHSAKDVTQAVFVALAQNAPQLTNHPVLSGWLYCTARNLAAKTIRSDVRRRAREQEAAAMSELLSAEPDASWAQVAPHLDQALGELNEADRDALLLRFFERKSAREMADILGITAEAAQKRVSRALERLREFFAKRSVTVGASGLGVVLSAHAVQAAPVGLATAISAAAALAESTVTATATATKAIAMTALQKTLVTVTIAVAVGTGIYQARQVHHLRARVQSLEQRQAPLAAQVEELTRERDDATRQLAGLRDENARLNRNTSELLKLRGENTRLRAASGQTRSDPMESAAKSWMTRVDQLKQRLQQMPEAQIPELQFLSDEDWLAPVKDSPLDTDREYRRALSTLRRYGEMKFAQMLQPALREYLNAKNGRFPTDLSQLQSYFKSPVDDAILQRYAIVPASTVRAVQVDGDWAITQKAAVDEEFDARHVIGPNGYGSTGFKSMIPNEAEIEVLSAMVQAYSATHGGQKPTDPSQLQPHATTPEQEAALRKVIQAVNTQKSR